MNRKKLISILLTLCMFFSNFQPVIYALDTTEAPEDTNAVKIVEEATDSELMDDVEISEEDIDEVEAEKPAEEAEEETLQDDQLQEDPETDTSPETEPEEEPSGEEIEPEDKEESTVDPAQDPVEDTEIIEDAVSLFNGMPEDYVLSAEELAEKQTLKDKCVLDDLAKSVEGEDYIAGQVTYYFTDEEIVETVANAYNAEILEKTRYYAVFALAEGTTVVDAMAYAAADNNVPAVSPRLLYKVEEPNLIAEGNEMAPMGILTEIPEITGWEDWGRDADPHINLQWTWYQWHLREIGVFEAWATTQGSDKITVAVIDSGIVDTEDMDGKEVCLDPWGDISTTTVSSGHGTHVAGIIGANYNNDLGGTGIAPGVNIQNYQVTNSSGSIVSDYVIRAIRTAVDSGADVINLSLGGPIYNSKMDSAVQYAINHGVVVVAAAGNDRSNIKNYPAAYEDVITVEALTPNRETTYFSTYGTGDISAPGEAIVSTYGLEGDMYVKMDGTSQASPIVSGVIALYLSVAGDGTGDVNNDGYRNRYDVYDVLDAIVKTGEKVNTKNAPKMISASKLIASVIEKPVATVMVDGNESYIYNNKIHTPVIIEDGITQAELVLNSFGENDYYIAYTLDGKLPKIKDGVLSVGTTYTGPIDITQLPDGKYKLRAVAVNHSGVNSSATSVDFEIKHSDSRFLTVTGPRYVAKGKSVTFKSTLNTIKGTVAWRIDNDAAYAGVTISSKGVLKIPANPWVSKVTVTAYVKGNEKTQRSVDVYIKDPAQAVLISGVPAGNIVRDSDILQLTATAIGTDACDFKWTTSSAAIATVDENGVITPHKKGTVTITATTQDGTNLKASVKLTIAQLVDSINVISPVETLATGTKTKFTAEVLPAGANNTNVVWSVAEAGTGYPVYGINFDAKTKNQLNISNDVFFNGYITVTATAADGSGVIGTKDIRVTTSKATSITLSASKNATYKNGKLSAVSLYKYKELTDGVTLTANVQTTQYVGGYSVPLKWTSSNTDIVTVNQDGIVEVANNKTGKATITATAQDGSGVKATVTVNVANALYEFSVTNDNTIYANEELNIPRGGSYKFTTSAKDITGKAFKTSVVWAVEDNPDYSNIYVKDGKLTVGANAYFTDGAVINVVASSSVAPETGSSIIRIPVVLRAYKATKIEYVKTAEGRMPNATTATLFTTDAEWSDYDYTEVGEVDESVLPLNVVGYYGSAKTGYRQLNYTPSVAFTSTGAKYSDIINENGEYSIKARKAGNYKVTAKTVDGSGKSTALSVKNIIPASDLTINSSQPEDVFIAPGKSLQLNAYLGASYGKPTVSKVKWGYIAPDGCKVSLSSTGKLTVNKANKKWAVVTVYAMSMDCAGFYDEYEVCISGSATSFMMPLYKSEQFYDNKGRLCVPANGSAELYFTADTLGSHYTLESIVDVVPYSDVFNLGFKASSNNITRSGVRGGISYDGYYYYRGIKYPVYKLTIIGGTQTGESTITVTTRDGTNKKISMKVLTL